MNQTSRFLRVVTMVIAVAAGGCCTTTFAASPGWIDQSPESLSTGRTGHVESIQEAVQLRRESSGAGAVAGALFGGVIGYASSGDAGGAVVGAAEGAFIGADAGAATSRRSFYRVVVRFDDGDARTFVYEGWAPFQINQLVQEYGRGLIAQ